MAKNWNQQEISYLKRYAKAKSLADLAGRFDVGEDEVRRKLAALDLTTKDGEPPATLRGTAADPEIADYEAGLQALVAGKLAAAEKAFERVVGGSDRPELIARARQHLAMVARRRDAPDGDDDPFLLAVFERNRGDHGAAMALAERHAKADDDGRFALLAAGLHSLADRERDAVAALERAVEKDPANRVRAYHDPDLADLREKTEYAHLFALES